MSVIQAITVSVFARTWLVLTSAHAHLDLNWMPITPRAEVTERVTELRISYGHHVKQNCKNKNWIFTIPSWECVTKFLLHNRNSFYIADDVREIWTKRSNTLLLWTLEMVISSVLFCCFGNFWFVLHFLSSGGGQWMRQLKWRMSTNLCQQNWFNNMLL